MASKESEFVIPSGGAIMPVIERAATDLLAELRTARAESDRLFGILKPDAIYHRPIAERHRVLFYVGHLDGFDSIQICREGLGVRSPDPELDTLFQAGIDPDSSNLPSDQPSDWPSVEQVRAYVDRCRSHVDRHLEDAPLELVQMALEHRQMHLETLAYMFHNFAHDLKVAEPQSLFASNVAHRNEWIDIPAGAAILGRPDDGTFGWDNEFGQVKANVPAFRIQRYSVTNGEYLKYVEQGAAAPHFWVKDGIGYRYRSMFDEIPLPLDWPVYVTQVQAVAYATWLGKTIPSEGQFHRAAFGSPNGGCQSYPWGDADPNESLGNFDFRRWDPEPVTATPEGDSAFGVSQLIGNGWEWTKTPFAPFPGFQPRASYPGYSANFFDGEHYVIKGGSSRTAARLLRSSFRNWFRRDYPYTYSTFRCVEE